jgi:hypothetical protein
MGRMTTMTISDELVERLIRDSWPGGVYFGDVFGDVLKYFTCKVAEAVLADHTAEVAALRRALQRTHDWQTLSRQDYLDKYGVTDASVDFVDRRRLVREALARLAPSGEEGA